MRCQKINCLLSALVAGLALCCGVSQSMAAEDRDVRVVETPVDSEQEELAVYFETEGDYFLGYRWASADDSLKAAEYLYPHSSVSLGLNLLSCPLPYRYHVNAEFISNYDFYADAGFAYKDQVLFRDILVGAHHSFDTYNFAYDGEAGLAYEDRNARDDYYIDFVSNLWSLRLKAPDFPIHTFVTHRYVERDGTIQQRFVLGDMRGLKIVSEPRDINWKSNALKLGVNSHAGPVEIEYAYERDTFDPGHNNILYDNYVDNTDLSRLADRYPHNVVAETESSAHTVKMHSSYTGGFVAAATLSNLSQKNNYSLTESTTWKGAIDFSWIPDPMIGLFFKYRHKEVDMDTPSSVTLTGLSNTYNYAVRPGISYDKDVFSLSARYKPSTILSLSTNYEFSHLDRKNVDEWLLLSGQSNIHTFNFKAHLKPINKVKVKASYEYKEYSQPAYNSTPDNSNKIRLSTIYTPAPWANIYLKYMLSVTERDSLLYLNTNPSLLLESGERDGRQDQFLASLTIELSPKVSLTTSWFYQCLDVEQDLAYKQNYIDDDVLYTDQANAFSLSLYYVPQKDITLAADITHTIIEGTSEYDDVVGGAPFSLASFSALKASETTYSLEITKKLAKNWEIRGRYFMAIFDDKAYGLLDGHVFTTTFNIKRYF